MAQRVKSDKYHQNRKNKPSRAKRLAARVAHRNLLLKEGEAALVTIPAMEAAIKDLKKQKREAEVPGTPQEVLDRCEGALQAAKMLLVLEKAKVTVAEELKVRLAGYAKQEATP